MSLLVVKMVKLSPTMEEGIIARWLFKEGDRVPPEALLFEAQTDKATMGYNHPDGGYLRKILVKEGESAALGAPVAILSTEASESIDALLKELETKPEEKVEEIVSDQVVVKKEAASAAHIQVKARLASPVATRFPSLRAQKEDQYIKASPRAKHLAKEKALAISMLRPHDGWIDEKDLVYAVDEKIASLRSDRYPPQEAGGYDLVAPSMMRKTIAERLLESKQTIPHFYLSIDVEMDSLQKIRSECKESGIKLTVNDFIVRAVALSLADCPDMNLSMDPVSGKIARYHSVDLSIAVAIEEGLITPIIRHANYKRIEEISAEVRELASCAKKGELKPEDYQGGSFTISNLGMYGIPRFFAIINPPQAAILAVGSSLQKPIVKKGVIEVAEMMELGLSVDHRVIDGSTAAIFMQRLKYYLERPALLMV